MSRNKRISLISNGRKCCSCSKGSIVLEAALVMPVFVIVIFFFIYMVQMTLLSSQMQMVASNTVREVSTNIYPVALAVQSYAQKQETGTEGVFGTEGKSTLNTMKSISKLSLSELASQYASSFPSPISDWIKDAAAKGDEPLNDLKNQVAESVLDPVVKPILHPFLDGTLLKEERLHVNRIFVPDLKKGKTPYFGLEISYELPIKVPFTGRRIVLQAKAEERVWIGDTDELNKDSSGDEGTQGEAAIVLSKPSPAYAGHKAIVTAKVAPGSTAKLTVYYKSGVSQAKYLGEVTADENGIVEWKWLVGGNTTPGTWTFVIETQDGITTTASFNVESPNNK
ncbi:Flp pilus assembly protein TadG [Fontibacillus solani]|uniref:Flp pilus assembly protein TadG n=1 Tax=Fontibacillus solani TaxID=1572857 RepID=A0A7W3XRU2_9BACL|nr:pilus assembly protein [Fontibacillus solani]MBA9085836.1 Flp pilus assembly protein TadG [Fontibacillus solani]